MISHRITDASTPDSLTGRVTGRIESTPAARRIVRQLCLVDGRMASPGASCLGLSPPPQSETAHVASAGRVKENGKFDADIVDTEARERKVLPQAAMVMTLGGTFINPPIHPLLFDSCRCKQSAPSRCMACARRICHYGMVTERCKTWGGPQHA